MGEIIQKKFREILDSVTNAGDDFVNKYFSEENVDLNVEASSDIELTDEDVEVIKGEDDWFDYQGNIVNDEEANEEAAENNDVESTIGDNIDLSAIEKEIKNTTFEELDLNYNYEELVSKEFKKEDILELEKEEVETVQGTSYKKLSGDELISLLNKTDDGEDFFKEVEVK